MQKTTGKTGKRAVANPASVPYRAADYLRTNKERAAYLEALLEDGDPRVITVGLRDLAESIGGVAELAERTGLSRESLYRTLSPSGNPRLDTLTKLLHAMGLAVTVRPMKAAA